MTEQTDNASPHWSQLWQLPVLVVSLLMLAGGLVLTRSAETGPDYGGALDEAQQAIAASDFDRALTILSDLGDRRVDLNLDQRYRLRTLYADAVYLLQQAKGWDAAENHQKVVANYEEARGLGDDLDPVRYLSAERLERMAQSLISLGEVGAAREMLAEFDETISPHRQRLLKRMVVREIESPQAQLAEVAELIERFLAEPGLEGKDELWAVAREAELLLSHDRPGEAIDMLLRRIAFRQAEGQSGLAELKTLLAEAYIEVGELREAERTFLQAQQSLASKSDSLNGRILVGLGRIRFAEDNIVEALEHFADAVTGYPETEAYPLALIGKAECEARLGSHAEALADYAIAVEGVEAGRLRDIRDRLLRSLESRYDIRYAQADFESALKYLELLMRVAGGEPAARLLVKLAVVHEQLARQLLGVEDGDPINTEAWDRLSTSEKALARKHFESSAEAYLRHARAVTVNDDAAFGQSLWRAGDNYDKAALHKRAIEVFAEFVEARPNDPRQLEATFRLAQSYQADRQYEVAAKLYEQLWEEHPQSPEGYQSLVPLAQCHLAQGPEYVDEAERVLLSVVTDHPALRPESRAYRQALIELGRLYHDRGEVGDYERAITRLTEAVERYGSDNAETADWLMRLGESYRKSADQIEKELAEPLGPARKKALGNERAQRLDEAAQSFNRVIDIYEAIGEAKLARFEKLHLRNAYFYRADCAYELGHYEGPEGAIALYDRAVQRYEKDPAVLVALVQIVNSYCELGRFEEARTVNERAKWHLKRIPESAFEDPTLPMSREHWQRWLDWTSQPAMNKATAGVETSGT